MDEFIKVAEPDELADGDRKSVILEDIVVLLVRTGDDYYAIEDVCSHDGQPLTDGPLAGCSIICPRHGARFDLKTGAPQCMPAVEGIPTLPVELRSDGVYLDPNC